MRTLSRAEVRRAIEESRQYTRSLVDDLDDAQWNVPRLPIVNPLLWEVGHLGWFMESWCLRWRGPDAAPAASRLEHADRWYDSARVAHDIRWDLDLPSRAATWRYLDEVLQATLERLERTADEPAALYFFQLALYHEDMHAEAFAYTRQTCGYTAPAPRQEAFPGGAVAADGDVPLAGGSFRQGAARAAEGFVFDNEKWSHDVALAPFSIARRPVSAGEFAAFVDDGGYARAALWDDAGRTWLAARGAQQPVYWRRGERGWQQRSFDRWHDIDPAAPMVHVNRHEAAAWCRWAGRRLPTESEWEFAAAGGHITPSVWEWTATPFRPYPGFQPDPYAEYSAPWFESHRSVRGASAATASRMRHPRYRNFYTPERADVFVGFRSCALE
jgi:iron(II)-dependent oxidoreductase